MSGIDQIVWNLTHDQDLFCIWGMATPKGPLKENLVNKALAFLIKTIPIPVANWLYGKWHLIEKKEDLMIKIKTDTDNLRRQMISGIPPRLDILFLRQPFLVERSFIPLRPKKPHNNISWVQ